MLIYLVGMQAIEAVQTGSAAPRYDLVYYEDMEDYSAVAWPIVGHFKAHNDIAGAGCYMIPITGTRVQELHPLHGHSGLLSI